MSIHLTVPKFDGSQLDIKLGAGGCIFVVGANGSGKSSLLYHWGQVNHNGQTVRIRAQRQTWMMSDGIELQAAKNRYIARNSDLRPESRWRGDQSLDSPTIWLYNLVQAENLRARKIVAAVEANDLEGAKKLSAEKSLIATLNTILRLSNISIEILLNEDVGLAPRFSARREDGDNYGVAQLSDGERTILLIAANVLSCPSGSLILIDEPERHLHRSIVAPFLFSLISKKSDCYFVVSTHDIELPFANPGAACATILQLFGTNCSVVNDDPKWDAQVLSGDYKDEFRDAILGCRRRILFVEGDGRESLDKPLYALLFPKIAVVPKGNCREVERAVIGIRKSEDHHRIIAFGLVDNDGRTPEDVAQLRAQGIYALPLSCVESIYYDPQIQTRIVEKLFGAAHSDRVVKAKKAALVSTRQHLERLSNESATRLLRQRVYSSIPENISELPTLRLEFDVAEIRRKEETCLNVLLEAEDIATIIQKYPLRTTPAFDHIAKHLGFKSRHDYEAAVIKLLTDDSAALESIRLQLELLCTDLAAQ